MNSVLSHKERGKWGKSSWRGNNSGNINMDLFSQYYKNLKGSSFCDPMAGSFTAVEAAKDFGIEKVFGLDLHSGFNILRDSIVDTIGMEVDMCFSHPPYSHLSILYSGHVWGTEPHPDDLSHTVSIDDFNEKLHQALLNQRLATKRGSVYGMLMGDVRKNGAYHSFQAEMISRMPKNELASVIIKAQHNCNSDSIKYTNMKHAFCTHEYIVLWERSRAITSFLGDLQTMAVQQSVAIKGIWKSIVRQAMVSLGGKAELSKLYEKISLSAPEKLSKNEHWQAKVRQVLQNYADFKSLERGVWSLT